MPPDRPAKAAHPVIVFDGVCVLCSRWVDFIVSHDHAGRFRLAAMQGTHGRACMLAHGLAPDDPVSLLLVDGTQGHLDTDAIVRILAGLGQPWRMAAALLRIVPRRGRDSAYRWIARRRYRLFGRRPQCRVPEPGQAWRFLD